MKLKYEMTTVDMDGMLMAVPIEDGGAFNGIIRINETTAEILDLLKNETTQQEIIAELLKRYDADEDEIKNSVIYVIDVLKANDLLI